MRRRFSLVSTVILSLCTVVIIASAVYANDVLLPKGFKLVISFDIDVSSKYARPNEMIPISVREPVKYGGIEVIAAGTKGKARVVSVTPAAKGGKPGAIEVELVELDEGNPKTESGKAVKIESVDKISAEGISKKKACLYIGGLFKKGTEGEIKRGESFEARTVEDVVILLN